MEMNIGDVEELKEGCVTLGFMRVLAGFFRGFIRYLSEIYPSSICILIGYLLSVNVFGITERSIVFDLS